MIARFFPVLRRYDVDHESATTEKAACASYTCSAYSAKSNFGLREPIFSSWRKMKDKLGIGSATDSLFAAEER